jgi:hypothetical protein
MNEEKSPQRAVAEKRLFPATVVAVTNEFKVAINRGSDDGVREGQRFLVYALSEKELIDPETNESLGRLEIVRGPGIVTHVQPRLATVECTFKSNPTKKIIKKGGGSAWTFGVEQSVETFEEAEPLPFDNAKVGDRARPI